MVEITRHARKRMRRRYGAKTRQLAVALEAYMLGRHAGNTRGEVRGYLLGVARGDRCAMLHKGFVWVFDEDCLITLFCAPWRIRRLMQRKRGRADRRRREELGGRLRGARRRKRRMR